MSDEVLLSLFNGGRMKLVEPCFHFSNIRWVDSRACNELRIFVDEFVYVTISPMSETSHEHHEQQHVLYFKSFSGSVSRIKLLRSSDGSRRNDPLLVLGCCAFLLYSMSIMSSLCSHCVISSCRASITRVFKAPKRRTMKNSRSASIHLEKTRYPVYFPRCPERIFRTIIRIQGSRRR